MADAIKFDASGAVNSYLEYALASLTALYVRTQVYLPGTSLADWWTARNTQTGDLIELDDTGGTEQGLLLVDDVSGSAYDSWEDYLGPSDLFSPVALGDEWITVELWQPAGGGAGYYKIAGTAKANSGFTPAGGWQIFRMGYCLWLIFQRLDHWFAGRIQLGTTEGGTDILNFDPTTASDLSAFSLHGSVTLATAPTPPPPFGPPTPQPSSIGIRVAFGYNAFDTAAQFIRVDEPTVPPLTITSAANNVIAWQIDRGRSYELDKTQAGTAQFTLLDTSGIFDPTNPASPLWGKIVPMLQAKIGVQNPFTGAYTDLFTGFLESWDWTITTEEKLVTIQVGLVDGFEPLTRAEVPLDGNGLFIRATEDVQVRIDTLLDIAGWPTDPGDKSWRDVNTGNVGLLGVIYNAQQTILAAMQDAADAEFPGVANIFMSKRGAVAFRGRYPRFAPTLYPQDVTFWTVCDRGGQSEAPTAALIKDIEWTLDQKNVINACLCYPSQMALTLIAAQLSTNPASIVKYGTRTLSLPDLLVDHQPPYSGPPPPPHQPSLTGPQVCFTYAQYYTQNYGQPQVRISKLVFEATDATDVNTWNFMLGVEIGDIITVITTTPGGGFGKGTGSPESPTPAQFFVEGIHYTASIQGDVRVITMSLDVSPRGWFTIAPFTSP